MPEAMKMPEAETIREVLTHFLRNMLQGLSR